MSKRDLQETAEEIVHKLIECGCLSQGHKSSPAEKSNTGGHWCRISEVSNGIIDLWCDKYRSLDESEFYYGYWTESKTIIDQIQLTFCDNSDVVHIRADDETHSERGHTELALAKARMTYEAFIMHSSAKHRWFGRYASGKTRQAIVEEAVIFYADAIRYSVLNGTEGTPRTSIATRYERNPAARAECLRCHGYACMICSFDFEATYGAELGRHFIHVHHIAPLSQGERVVSPKHDLVPVCPNCHAMLHRQSPPMLPDELRHKLQR